MKQLDNKGFNANTPAKEENCFYGEITLGITIKSKSGLKYVQEWLSAELLRAKIELEHLDGSKIKTSVEEIHELNLDVLL